MTSAASGNPTSCFSGATQGENKFRSRTFDINSSRIRKRRIDFTLCALLTVFAVITVYFLCFVKPEQKQFVHICQDPTEFPCTAGCIFFDDAHYTRDSDNVKEPEKEFQKLATKCHKCVGCTFNFTKGGFKYSKKAMVISMPRTAIFLSFLQSCQYSIFEHTMYKHIGMVVGPDRTPSKKELSIMKKYGLTADNMAFGYEYSQDCNISDFSCGTALYHNTVSILRKQVKAKPCIPGVTGKFSQRNPPTKNQLLVKS